MAANSRREAQLEAQRERRARAHARGAAVPFADPVDAASLAEATESELHEVVTALERLREHYEFERRGLVLRELAGGWQLSSHPDAEPAARRLLAKPRTPPLTPAQAETLAIVAYLQPVSRPEIARIRGVNAESAARRCSSEG